MCTITNKLKRKSVKGWKLAYKRGGKWFSPYTGIEYKTGTIEPLVVPNEDPNLPCLPNAYFLILPKESMEGLTAVFKNRKSVKKTWTKDAFEIEIQYSRVKPPDDVTFVILEMTLEGNLHKGTFIDRDVFLGSTITEVKEVETIEYR